VSSESGFVKESLGGQPTGTGNGSNAPMQTSLNLQVAGKAPNDWRLISVLVLLLGCLVPFGARAAQAPSGVSGPEPVAAIRVREPAVAGLFYPKDKEALSKMIDTLLSATEAESIADLKALICPHAGYPYSGPTAACAYRLLPGREFKTVVVMGPSHYALLTGAAVSRADVFRTPLGTVEISERAKDLARLTPFVLEASSQVERPSWASVSSRPAPALGQDTADTWEHSDEVQVPFLQKVLKEFKLIPVVFGDVDPAKAAKRLSEQVDNQTLLIASSDLSHYHPYAEAKALDTRCVQAICNLDVEQMKSQEACGKVPILTLMYLAREKGWKARLLDYRNSGDTAGDRGRVVGYAAIAFYGPGQESLTVGERRVLLELARKTVKDAAKQGRPSEVATNGIAGKLLQLKGCFVTLTKSGQLRGCIGHILPQEALYQAISDNASSAALRDPRFRPVRSDEVDEIQIEISILTEPRWLRFTSTADLLSQLRPHKDGVVLRIGVRSATYLPQVWAQLPDKVTFMNSLAEKAGCTAAAWRDPGTAVATYQVESFKESE
jgi:MEMO1 family protein